MVCDILLTTGKPWLLPSFLGNQSHRPLGFSMEHVDWCRLGSPYRYVPGPESLCCASDHPLARNRSFWALAVQPPGKIWKIPRHSAIHGGLEIWRLPAWTLLDFQRMGKELHLIEATLGCWSLPNCYPHYPAAGSINPSPKNMKTDLNRSSQVGFLRLQKLKPATMALTPDQKWSANHGRCWRPQLLPSGTSKLLARTACRNSPHDMDVGFKPLPTLEGQKCGTWVFIIRPFHPLQRRIRCLKTCSIGESPLWWGILHGTPAPAGFI